MLQSQLKEWPSFCILGAVRGSRIPHQLPKTRAIRLKTISSRTMRARMPVRIERGFLSRYHTGDWRQCCSRGTTYVRSARCRGTRRWRSTAIIRGSGSWRRLADNLTAQWRPLKLPGKTSWRRARSAKGRRGRAGANRRWWRRVGQRRECTWVRCRDVRVRVSRHNNDQYCHNNGPENGNRKTHVHCLRGAPFRNACKAFSHFE